MPSDLPYPGIELEFLWPQLRSRLPFGPRSQASLQKAQGCFGRDCLECLDPPPAPHLPCQITPTLPLFVDWPCIGTAFKAELGYL